MRVSGSSKIVGKLAKQGVRMIGSSVACNESSPRCVRNGLPVIAKIGELRAAQKRRDRLTNNISTSGKLAEFFEFLGGDPLDFESAKVT